MSNKQNTPESAVSAFAGSATVPPPPVENVEVDNDMNAQVAAQVFAQASEAIDERRRRIEQGREAYVETTADKRARLASRRKNRVSLNGLQPKLDIKFNFNMNEWYVYIFRDDGNRVRDALNAGYEFIKLDEVTAIPSEVSGGDGEAGDRLRVVLGHKDNGDALYGFPMKQPMEFRQDDLEEREIKNFEVDTLIREGRLGATQDEKRYIPKDTPINYDAGRIFRQPSR